MSGEANATGGNPEVADAVAERRRMRDARLATAAELSMREVLVGIAERSEIVVLSTRSTRYSRVRVDVVVDGAVICRTSSGQTLALGTDAIVAISSVSADQHEADDPIGDATAFSTSPVLPTPQSTMSDIVSQWATLRPRVSVTTGGAVTTGTLQSVGSDVVEISTGASGMGYVRLDSTTEISASFSS